MDKVTTYPIVERLEAQVDALADDVSAEAGKAVAYDCNPRPWVIDGGHIRDASGQIMVIFDPDDDDGWWPFVVAAVNAYASPAALPAPVTSAIWLWCTWPKLELGMKCLQRWGFTYKTGGAWHKKRWGTGYIWRSVCEPVLIGTKGASRGLGCVGARSRRAAWPPAREVGEGRAADPEGDQDQHFAQQQRERNGMTRCAASNSANSFLYKRFLFHGEAR